MDLTIKTIKIQIKVLSMRSHQNNQFISVSSFTPSHRSSSQQNPNQQKKKQSAMKKRDNHPQRQIKGPTTQYKKSSTSRQKKKKTSSLGKKSIPKKRSESVKLLKEISQQLQRHQTILHSILQQQQSTKDSVEYLGQTILQEHKSRNEFSDKAKEFLFKLYLSVEDKLSHEQKDYFSNIVIESLEMPKIAAFQSEDQHQPMPAIITPKLNSNIELGLDEVEKINDEAQNQLIQPPLARRFKKEAIKSQEEVRVNLLSQTLKELSHDASQNLK